MQTMDFELECPLISTVEQGISGWPWHCEVTENKSYHGTNLGVSQVQTPVTKMIQTTKIQTVCDKPLQQECTARKTGRRKIAPAEGNPSVCLGNWILSFVCLFVFYLYARHRNSGFETRKMCASVWKMQDRATLDGRKLLW